MKSKSRSRHHIQPDHTHPEGFEEAHHGHINPEPYGQKYPKGASAVESHTERGIQTQVETHRTYLKHQQEIFGDVLPDIKGTEKELELNMMSELLYVTKKSYTLDRARVPLGQAYTIPLTISGGSLLTHINFRHEEPQNQRWAPGMNIEVPGRKLTTVQVYNDTGGVIAFGTNLPMNDYRATNKVTSGMSQTVTFDWPVIESMNIVSTSGNSTIRILIMY